jgi:hypothetical protein
MTADGILEVTDQQGATMLGNNIAGHKVVLGARYVTDSDAFIAKNTKRHQNTPIFEQKAIPQGRYCHIGDGVWLRRCSACDDYTLTYGTVLYLNEHLRHEASHGIDVIGVNIPILPRAT